MMIYPFNIISFVMVEFIADFTDNFFQDVFHRDDPRCSAVFIDNDCHMDVLALHAQQNILDWRLVVDERQVMDRQAFREISRCRVARQQFLDIDKADDGVFIAVFSNGIACILMFFNNFH